MKASGNGPFDFEPSSAYYFAFAELAYQATKSKKIRGEFWDKLRALFVHGATVRFPRS